MVAAPPRPALSGLAVAPMRRRHLRAVLAIEEAVYPRPWSHALFASEIARRDSRRYLVGLVPREAGRVRPHREVVGYAGLMMAVDEAHVTTVAVHPEHHRQKVATHLLLALMIEARTLGAEAATLEVRVANRGAQRLYAAFGFAPVGVRPGYYAETGEDAVIMWAHGLQSEEIGERLAAQRARLAEPGGASGAPDLHVPWVRGRVGLGDARTSGAGPNRPPLDLDPENFEEGRGTRPDGLTWEARSADPFEEGRGTRPDGLTWEARSADPFEEGRGTRPDGLTGEARRADPFEEGRGTRPDGLTGEARRADPFQEPS